MACLSLLACRSGESGASSGQSVEARHLAADEFQAFIETPGKVAVVVFHADWCGPCKMFAPIVEEAVAESGDQVILGRINVDEAQQLAQSLGVQGIPDLRVYRNGLMVDATKGVMPKEQLAGRLAVQVDQLAAAGTSTTTTGEPAIAPGQPGLPPGMQRR